MQKMQKQSKKADITPQDFLECPVQLTLELLGGRWKLPIIHSLHQSTKRFKELERDVSGVTPKMLTKQLRDLEVNDIVHREYFPTIPPTVEYSLTEYGRTIVPLVLEIKKWGMRHQKRKSLTKNSPVQEG
ncbi:MAG: helix-turn-helix transcriptional regulator [Candidatus Kapabacteria bacterium]|jgi:DNA-binding HxlR family transcriptional regulator|nr:helix-turn-helix transcriptional regulator [Candidatus Kapabacteria bacterium]